MNVKAALRTQWDRASALAAVLLGVLVLLIGYLGVSSTEFVAEQIPYVISGGLVGLCLVIAGATLWISADLRDEWRKLDALDARLEGLSSTAGVGGLWGAPVVQATAPVAAPALPPAASPPRKSPRRASSVRAEQL